MRRLLILALLPAVIAACGKKEAPVSAAAPPPAAEATASAPVTPAASAANAAAPNLLAFSGGALIIQKPQEYGNGWTAVHLLDERADSGWATPEDVVTPQVMVIELPEQTLLDRLSFDNASSDGDDARSAKDLTVEMSNTNATSGFQQIASVSLQDKVDNQSFPVTASVAGRWLRVTVKTNHGSKKYTELAEIRGYGKQLTQTPFANASGTYETNYGNFHLRQEGTSVTGCYEHDSGLLSGGLEGRVMKFTWREEGNESGPAIMVFTSDGKQMFGLWWSEGDTNRAGGEWDGKKISDDVGSCPHWSGKKGAEEQMTKELEDFGRTRVYGINFDLDSDVLKGESKPVLDKIAMVLKAKPEWKLKVEGHTDATGGDAHNQQLSQKRADAVKAYLVTAGIEGTRLTTAGLGATKPVAANDSETGRAQNRRVELAKE